MRTADSIEQQKAEKKSGFTPKRGKDKKPRQLHANSLKNLVAPWTPETAPKNGGRPRDEAAEISRAAFRNNPQKIYEAVVAKLLAGDAYAYSVHADRGYGKLKQGVVHSGDDEGGPIQANIKVSFENP